MHRANSAGARAEAHESLAQVPTNALDEEPPTGADKGRSAGSGHVALVGTRGLPPRYGGFEAALAEIVPELAHQGLRVTVYSRGPGPATYEGARLVRLPALRRKCLETLSHTFLSLAHCLLVSKPDVVVVFNAANAPLLSIFPFRRTIIHVDGLEWQRSKWGRIGRAYYQSAEWFACRLGWAVIADARGIESYYRERWHRETRFIPYGARRLAAVDHVVLDGQRYSPGDYFLIVARFEPENHVLEMVSSYVRSGIDVPLIVVGDAPYSADYVRAVREVAATASVGDVRFTGAVWDQELLDRLYSCARAYLHGHMVGGTNPSLLRACGASVPVIAWDVVFNREVLGDRSRYFSSEEELAHLLREDAVAERWARVEMPEAFWELYNWPRISRLYADVIHQALSARQAARARRGPTRTWHLPTLTGGRDGRTPVRSAQRLNA